MVSAASQILCNERLVPTAPLQVLLLAISAGNGRLTSQQKENKLDAFLFTVFALKTLSRQMQQSRAKF